MKLFNCSNIQKINLLFQQLAQTLVNITTGKQRYRYKTVIIDVKINNQANLKISTFVKVTVIIDVKISNQANFNKSNTFVKVTDDDQ